MRIFKRIAKNKMAALGSVIVLSIVIVSLLGSFIATHDPMAMDLAHIGAIPSVEHLWGTDELGRDIFSRVTLGTQTSLKIGIAVVWELSLGRSLGWPVGTLLDRWTRCL